MDIRIEGHPCFFLSFHLLFSFFPISFVFPFAFSFQLSLSLSLSVTLAPFQSFRLAEVGRIAYVVPCLLHTRVETYPWDAERQMGLKKSVKRIRDAPNLHYRFYPEYARAPLASLSAFSFRLIPRTLLFFFFFPQLQPLSFSVSKPGPETASMENEKTSS